MHLQLPDIDVTSFTVKLSNGMTVTISEPGHGPAGFDGQPVIEVRQKGRELPDGAYAPSGEYLLGLPDAYVIGGRCDAPNATLGHGHAIIMVEHRH